ncbi:MAG: hypothetical protein ACXU9D_01620 [Xanthobacteraceae bacterium]
MPVAVIAMSMLMMLVVATPSAASPSCMSKAEARQHFGSLHIYWHGRGRCWDATPARRLARIHRDRAYRRIHEVRRSIDQPKWHDSMSKLVSGDELVQTAPQTPWMDRWVDIEPSMPLPQTRRIDVAQAGPPPIVERKAEPMVSLNFMLMALVTIGIATTLATIEFLFRRTV